MSLIFSEIKLNIKEFHRSKQPIYINQAEISKTVFSDEFKLDDRKTWKLDVKNFIGYKNGETMKPLCIILPQMILHVIFGWWWWWCNFEIQQNLGKSLKVT